MPRRNPEEERLSPRTKVMFFFDSDQFSVTLFSCLNVSYLPQLAQDDAEVLVQIHLLHDGGQVVFDGLGTKAGVKLVYVVVVERERVVADGHLGDISCCALDC